METNITACINQCFQRDLLFKVQILQYSTRISRNCFICRGINLPVNMYLPVLNLEMRFMKIEVRVQENTKSLNAS